MKSKKLIALLVGAVLVVVLLLASCTPAPSTTTPKATSTSLGLEKTVNAMSPRGIQLPVQIKPLAARLDTFDGKTIYICQGEADPIIMPALYERLQKDYPKTKWVNYLPSSSFGATTPDDQTKAEAKAVIRGISW